jgi:hypothetical protein
VITEVQFLNEILCRCQLPKEGLYSWLPRAVARFFPFDDGTRVRRFKFVCKSFDIVAEKMNVWRSSRGCDLDDANAEKIGSSSSGPAVALYRSDAESLTRTLQLTQILSE